MSIQARIHARYPGFDLDADIEIPATGVTGLFGPSGSGKSTILRAIAGLDRHDNTRLTVNGETWQDESVFLPPHQRPLGYVFQEPSLFAHLDVRGNIEYGLRRIANHEQRISPEQAAELLGLEALMHRRVQNLSGGERQRVAMARALAVSPGLLLMDEPLAALDLERKAEILPYLESLVSELEIPLIYVSHSSDEVARLSDHLVLLGNGNVIGAGPISEMLTRIDLPLSRSAGAEAIVPARVSGYDDGFSLNYLEFPGGRFTVPGAALQRGSEVRLRVAARDVSLTLDLQKDTSILNIFDATVESLSPEGDSQVVVRLDVGGVSLLAHVTRKSAEALQIGPGKRLYAQVKGVAVLS
jgi:molybdate transport system ATP-binding protein